MSIFWSSPRRLMARRRRDWTELAILSPFIVLGVLVLVGLFS
jgi:hypothetical protein